MAEEAQGSSNQPSAALAKPPRPHAQLSKHVTNKDAVVPFLVFNLPDAPPILSIGH